MISLCTTSNESCHLLVCLFLLLAVSVIGLIFVCWICLVMFPSEQSNSSARINVRDITKSLKQRLLIRVNPMSTKRMNYFILQLSSYRLYIYNYD